MKQGMVFNGETVREAGLSIHAIRFYEAQGILRKGRRTESGYQVYLPETVEELKFITRAQELGFSLGEIRELLVLRRDSTEACSHVCDMLRQKLHLVEEKVRQLAHLREELKSDLQKCNQGLKRTGVRVETACPVLEKLGKTKEEARIRR